MKKWFLKALLFFFVCSATLVFFESCSQAESVEDEDEINFGPSPND